MKYTDVVKLMRKQASATLEDIHAQRNFDAARALATGEASPYYFSNYLYRQLHPAAGVRSPLNDNDYQQIAQQIYSQLGNVDPSKAQATYNYILNQVRAKGAGYRQNAVNQQQIAGDVSGMMRAHPGLTREDAERLISEQANRLAGMGYQFAPNPENYDFSDTDIYVPNNRYQRQMNAMNADAEAAVQKQVAAGQRRTMNSLGYTPISDEEAAQVVRDSYARQEAKRRQQQADDEAAYNEFRKTLPVGNAANTQTLAPGAQVTMATPHAAPSVEGRPTKEHEDRMGAARVQMKAEDQAMANGTFQTRGSGSIGTDATGTVAFGQPIQRDAATGVTVHQPTAGAKVIRQSRIGNQVFDHYDNGQRTLNQELSDAYARGERPALMKQQPKPQPQKQTGTIRRTPPTGNVRNVAPTTKTQFK